MLRQVLGLLAPAIGGVYRVRHILNRAFRHVQVGLARFILGDDLGAVDIAVDVGKFGIARGIGTTDFYIALAEGAAVDLLAVEAAVTAFDVPSGAVVQAVAGFVVAWQAGNDE
ncbi:hypothetical protein [Halomonas binhaiensis]|uniref:Uncharacterized protein n=1 Tax=Halomonas binhaiensis TaxID=2562282 RepID=A0A7U3K5T9_9GAMM|nr:hypothetical protein [Halomonas binhaiensis]QRG26814.1 hypothetical protein E4T21_21520 [Halomonas binhaiensis]